MELKLNLPMVKGMLNKFPEIITLINSINALSNTDRVFYRDNLFFILLANTCNDGEILGVLSRMSYFANKELDKV